MVKMNVLQIIDNTLTCIEKDRLYDSFNNVYVVKTYLRFLCAYFFAAPGLRAEEYLPYVERVVCAFCDRSGFFCDIIVNLTEFMAIFVLVASDNQVMAFIEETNHEFYEQIVSQMFSRETLLVTHTLNLISSLTGLNDDVFIDWFVRTDFIRATFDLLKVENPNYREEIFHFLGNIFISSSPLSDKLIEYPNMILYITSFFLVCPENDISPLNCLRNLFQNIDNRCLEAWVVQNIEVTGIFLEKIDDGLKSSVMLKICEIIKMLLFIGDNISETDSRTVNPIREYIEERPEMAFKLQEAQDHKDQSVREAFYSLVVEFFEYKEEYSFGI
jgi:hypothetical protein